MSTGDRVTWSIVAICVLGMIACGIVQCRSGSDSYRVAPLTDYQRQELRDNTKKEIKKVYNVQP